MTQVAILARLFKTIPALSLLALLPTIAVAQDVECSGCHAGVTFSSAAHPDLNCQDCHTNVTAEHKGADLAP
ncbi:MAG: hypothetical protein OEM92_10265, partial [Gammaproteobacteria bacterium]|nr:hypothetical protein [Gammaproteobacteria bacterium]